MWMSAGTGGADGVLAQAARLADSNAAAILPPPLRPRGRRGLAPGWPPARAGVPGGGGGLWRHPSIPTSPDPRCAEATLSPRWAEREMRLEIIKPGGIIDEDF